MEVIKILVGFFSVFAYFIMGILLYGFGSRWKWWDWDPGSTRHILRLVGWPIVIVLVIGVEFGMSLVRLQEWAAGRPSRRQ